MPANLTPAYYNAEEKFKEAKTPRDKLKALRGMLTAIPKHKGTEKLQADLKRKIAQFTLEEERSHGKGGRGPSVDHVPREGAGQVVLVGEPNVGKSALFVKATGAPAEVAPYPYTTRKPHPGMMHFEDVQIQIVDSPPYSDEYQEPWLPNVARYGHGLLIVLDVTLDTSVEEQLSAIRRRLETFSIGVVPANADRDDRDGEDCDFIKSALVVANKCDSGERSPAVVDRFEVIPVSAETGEGIEELGEPLFRMLRVIRVYTKIPGHKADRAKPFVLPELSTTVDFCRVVHKDFAEKLRFARLWREGAFQGIQIHGDHELHDRDVVELHL